MRQTVLETYCIFVRVCSCSTQIGWWSVNSAVECRFAVSDGWLIARVVLYRTCTKKGFAQRCESK